MSITLSQVSHSFDNQLVVNNVSLEIADGEFFVLLGGSGSGKSTLLRLIAGLLPLEQGSITLHGRDVTHLPPQERDTGFVFQNYSLFGHLSARENIEFGLRIRGAAEDERHTRSSELLELVGLSGLGGRFPSQLSGGQQQRVALARALAYNPSVLLLDEPFGALDVKIRAQLRETVKSIQRQLKITAILVTHDQEEAFFLADRIALIDQGHIVEVATPENLYHRPRSELAGSFIGGGNLLVGRIVEGKIRLGNIVLDLPSDAPAHEESSPVRVLFRPESVVQQSEPFGPESGVIPLGKGRVVSRSFLGASERVRIELDNVQGVRVLAPPIDYGVRFASIEASVASAEIAPTSGPSERWVGIRRYHVLDPTGLKVLVVGNRTPSGGPAWSFGTIIARTAKGPWRIMETAGSASDLPEVSNRLQSILSSLPPGRFATPSSHARTGVFHREVVRELSEGSYELCIIERPSREVKHQEDFWTRIRKILDRASVPLLLVRDTSPPSISKVLLCTGGGEPGKADIRFGGRIARIMGARASVFHAKRSGISEQELKRIERHMLHSFHFLQVMGVQSTICLAKEPALPSLLYEAETGSYDLIVVGAPPPEASRRVTPFHVELAMRTDVPILVVPMEGS